MGLKPHPENIAILKCLQNETLDLTPWGRRGKASSCGGRSTSDLLWLRPPPADGPRTQARLVLKHATGYQLREPDRDEGGRQGERGSLLRWLFRKTDGLPPASSPPAPRAREKGMLTRAHSLGHSFPPHAALWPFHHAAAGRPGGLHAASPSSAGSFPAKSRRVTIGAAVFLFSLLKPDRSPSGGRPAGASSPPTCQKKIPFL